MKRARLIWFTAAGLAACSEGGGLIDPEYPGVPLATFRGTLETSEPPAPGTVSIAIMWSSYSGTLAYNNSGGMTTFGPQPACDGVRVPAWHVESSFTRVFAGLETLELETQFPINFTFPINDLPPPDAYFPMEYFSEGTGSYATGKLIAFVDGNGDGQLQLPVPGTAPDTVVALSSVEIIYVDGQVAATGTTTPPRTYRGVPVADVAQGFQIFDVELGAVFDPSTPIAIVAPTTPYEQADLERDTCGTMEQHCYGGGEPYMGLGEYWDGHPMVPDSFPAHGWTCWPWDQLDYDDNVIATDVVFDWWHYVDTQDPCLKISHRGRACTPQAAPRPEYWPADCPY